MGKRPLNLPFLGLQALLILIDCIAVAYVSPILVSFGYSPMRIGRVMTLAALAATLARPVWGNFVDFEQTPESSNDPYGDIRRVCGPMTELADFLCGETETYSKEPLKVPDLNAEAMVIQYLNYYFCQS